VCIAGHREESRSGGGGQMNGSHSMLDALGAQDHFHPDEWAVPVLVRDGKPCGQGNGSSIS